MAYKTFELVDINGVQLPVRFTDNGDGTYALAMAEAGMTNKTFKFPDANGLPIPLKFTDNGDGSYSPVGASGGLGGLKVNAPIAAVEGGQDAGAQLDYGLTIVTPPASNGSALQLPLAVVGASVILAMQTGQLDFYVAVWPKSGGSDTINGIGNDFMDFFMYASNYNAVASPHLIFTCTTDGAWVCQNNIPD